MRLQLNLNMKRKQPIIVILVLFMGCFAGNAQEYVKKVLESTEVEILYSYYNQDGNNAAVTGGEGTERLTDMTPTLVVNIPLNNNDVLTIDAGISAYTSASSSNINPFDGNNRANPWIESSGESRSDVLSYVNPTFSHSSLDRNHVVSINAAISSEYDYFSVGFGAGYTRLFNEKNTEIGFKGQVYLDKHNPQYPIELRAGFFDDRITGNGTYSNLFTEFDQAKRNSYALSFTLSQIFTQRLQASLSIDVIRQNGLLSTPFQRVYMEDRDDFFIEEFQLADDVERLPEMRFKIPLGGRFSYYLNDLIIVKGFLRYYYDDWGINSITGNLEIPLKISEKFTVYPMYRYYTQTAADYFYSKETALSTDRFYTSDYDLSRFDAHQYGIGITYKDVLAQSKVWLFGMKSISLRFNQYERSTGLSASIIALGFKFTMD